MVRGQQRAKTSARVIRLGGVRATVSGRSGQPEQFGVSVGLGAAHSHRALAAAVTVEAGRGADPDLPHAGSAFSQTPAAGGASGRIRAPHPARMPPAEGWPEG